MLAMLLVALLGGSDLQRPAAVAWYAELLADGGYGRLSRERAAFLIRETDGSLTLAPWSGSAHLRASWAGSIPDRAIAVVHTHPESLTDPSSQDRDEAARIGMPVVVVTPDAVTAALPGGGVVALAGRRWASAR